MSTITPTSTGETTRTPSAPKRSRRFYPWLVFALTIGLLLSDYMSRQVLSAVFPFLKAEWALSDSHLGSLNSVVALMVGLLTLPLSMLADRWGRVRSLVAMAGLWSVATLLCAVAGSYEQMLGARFLVGVGEAAYGSVGIAVVLSVFAPRLRASLSGAFMAGGSFGSVIGVVLGGVIAVQLSWRFSFAAMAIFGLILVALFWALVSDRKLARYAIDDDDTDTSDTATAAPGFRAPISSLFTNPAVLCAYIGGGLQMFTAAALMAWLPSFFGRSYGTRPRQGRRDGRGVRAAHRRRHDRVRHHHRPGRPHQPHPQMEHRDPVLPRVAHPARHRVPPRHRHHPADPDRRGRVLLRRLGRPDRRHRRQPHPLLGAGLRVRLAHPGQQPARAGRRPVHRRRPRRQDRPRPRPGTGPPRLHPRDRGPAGRQTRLPRRTTQTRRPAPPPTTTGADK